MGIRNRWDRFRELKRLRKADLETAESIPRKGDLVPSRVVSVYDGDTLTVAYMWGRQLYRTTIRVYGIDAPEMRGGSKLETQAATLVGAYVRSMIGNEVRVSLMRHDKYGGRVIGRVEVDALGDLEGNGPLDLGDHLIAQGFAKPYTGKKKEAWKPKELKEIVRKLQALA